MANRTKVSVRLFQVFKVNDSAEPEAACLTLLEVSHIKFRTYPDVLTYEFELPAIVIPGIASKINNSIRLKNGGIKPLVGTRHAPPSRVWDSVSHTVIFAKHHVEAKRGCFLATRNHFVENQSYVLHSTTTQR